MKDRLERYGLHKRIGREFFFPTIGVAVHAFLDRHPVEVGRLGGRVAQ